MQFPYFIALFFSLCVSVAIDEDAPVPGYGVVELQWNLTAPDGSPVTVTGTVEDVDRQISERNLTFSVGDSVSVNPLTTPVPLSVEDDIESFFCFGRWPGANIKRIRQGVNYLRGLRGTRPTNAPGPGFCGRVSCSWNSAIWWCNDNRRRKTLGSWQDVADGAEYIVNRCQQGPDTAGQIFYKPKWNVVVQRGKC